MDNFENVPHDFNWKTYLELNLDLTQNIDEYECKKHYNIYGYKEKRNYKKIDDTISIMQNNILNNYDIDSDFDWKTYKLLNPDLPQNLDEKTYIKHYILHGKNEKRKYKIEYLKYNLYVNDFLFIVSNNMGILFFINNNDIRENSSNIYLENEENFEVNSLNKNDQLHQLNESVDFDLLYDIIIRSDLTTNKNKVIDKTIFDFQEINKMITENMQNLYIFQIQENGKIIIYNNIGVNIYKNTFEIQPTLLNINRYKFIHLWLSQMKNEINNIKQIQCKNTILINYVFDNSNMLNLYYQSCMFYFTNFFCIENDLNIFFIVENENINLKSYTSVDNNEKIYIVKLSDYKKYNFKTNTLINIYINNKINNLFKNFSCNKILNHTINFDEDKSILLNDFLFIYMLHVNKPELFEINSEW